MAACVPLVRRQPKRHRGVFNLDPTGHFLYAAGQTSGRVRAYRIDPQHGTLQALHVFDAGARPLWVLFLDLANNRA